jgi:mono/diheme cytochrome c family protein
MMRALFFVCLILGLLLACGSAPEPVSEQNPLPTEGQLIFNAQCALCHGRKGNSGLSGAKDLTISTLKRAEMIALVSNGKGAMMAYKTQLSQKEIEAVVDHAFTLRKAP